MHNLNAFPYRKGKAARGWFRSQGYSCPVNRVKNEEQSVFFLTALFSVSRCPGFRNRLQFLQQRKRTAEIWIGNMVIVKHFIAVWLCDLYKCLTPGSLKIYIIITIIRTITNLLLQTQTNTEATTSLSQCINIFITLYHTLYWLIIESWSISLSSQTFLVLGIVDRSSSVTLLHLLFRVVVYNHNIYFTWPLTAYGPATRPCEILSATAPKSTHLGVILQLRLLFYYLPESH